MATGFVLFEREYFRNVGVDVMAFSDFYPSGHQSGVGIVMHDTRVATNGDLRFEATPGQWQPVPKQGERVVDRENNTITTTLSYPDMEGYLRGFNPMIYPDFEFSYKVCVQGLEDHVHVRVDLDRPVPKEFLGKLRFNLELYPGDLFGKGWIMDDMTGTFPQQPNGPTQGVLSNYEHMGHLAPLSDANASMERLTGGNKGYSPMVADNIIARPYASGHSFTVRPEDDYHRFTITSEKNLLELFDGRMNHNNGWFVLSSAVPAEATEDAISWDIYPSVIPDWKREPVVQVSAVGYHPAMPKCAVIELDSGDTDIAVPGIYKVGIMGKEKVADLEPVTFGNFLRYRYLQADFSFVKEPGLYVIRYQNAESSLFRIDKDVYERGVWQPVLEYFLPVQMCHMRVNEKYRVWHGLCHNDDARMSIEDYTSFDGAAQGKSTMTKYRPGEHVPGLNRGGWHDAGDYDLRIESQSGEAYLLSIAAEEFGLYLDETSIDQEKQVVEIHEPDGKNDVLQQIEHGLLNVVGGYRALGRLYHEIMSSDLRQYVLLGDGVNMTDGTPDSENERWVFTEDNPERELMVASHLAAASRTIREYNPELSADALEVAKELYEITRIPAGAEEKLAAFSQGTWTNRFSGGAISSKIMASVELFLTTKDEKYLAYIREHMDYVEKTVSETGWLVGRIFDQLSEEHVARVKVALKAFREAMNPDCVTNPYGIPYKPLIWGAGWGIQSMGVRNYFLHKICPDLFEESLVFNALHFILGCHPGTNKASFASGVGSDSATIAYGINRADWSYIPGGVISGTALIRPDLPELLRFPFLWQQTEYVLGGGSMYYLLLVLAVRRLLGLPDCMEEKHE